MTRPIGSACPELAFPKIRRDRSRQTPTRRRYAEKKWRDKVHDEVWARSQGRDEATGELLGDAGEMHECYPRAKTRKMAPERRFQTAWCIRVSSATHRKLTEHIWEVLFVDERGADRPDGIVCFHWKTLERRGKTLTTPMSPFVTAEEVWVSHPVNKSRNSV